MKTPCASCLCVKTWLNYDSDFLTFFPKDISQLTSLSNFASHLSLCLFVNLRTEGVQKELLLTFLIIVHGHKYYLNTQTKILYIAFLLQRIYREEALHLCYLRLISASLLAGGSLYPWMNLSRREKLHDNSAIPFSLSHEEAQKAGQLHSSRLHREHKTPTQSSTDRSRR